MRSLTRFLISLFFLALIPSGIIAQNAGDLAFLRGSWIGKLKVQAIELTMVMNFSFDRRDSLIVTIDSPDQGAKDLPTTKVEFRGDSIFVSSKPLNAIFKARILKEEKQMNGMWAQGPYSIPLALVWKEGKFEVSRPQEPKPPYPYHEEEVTIDNPAAGIVLSGTLTLPEGAGPFPAVVLITGSGPQNRDEEIFQHKPFLVIADWLTRHGIAVLRYDDRGVGGSGGTFATATTFDFASDALAALKYLKSRPEIDTTATGLLGHSEGGIIAPILASENPSVKFIIMLAGPGVRGDKILLMQTELILKVSGTPDKDIEQINATNTRIYSILEKEKDDSKAKARIMKILKSGNEKEHKQKVNIPLLTDQELEAKVNPLISPWFRTFLLLDPAKYLIKVHCPVLALDGELDLQVPGKINLDEIEKYLVLAGNSRYETVLYPKLNHLFQTAKTGLPDEYGKIEQTMAPEVLEKISGWILETVK